MLAMTVPMAAFADANVPTAKDVYSSAGGFVTFDVSLVPGEYSIVAKPTKGETVKVMVDGKEVSTFTVKKEGNVKIQATVDEKTEFESAFVLTLKYDFAKIAGGWSDKLDAVTPTIKDNTAAIQASVASIEAKIENLKKGDYNFYKTQQLYLEDNSIYVRDLNNSLEQLGKDVKAANENLAAKNTASGLIEAVEAPLAEIEALIGTSTDYAKVTKGYEAQVKALRTVKNDKAKALTASYEKGTAVADFVEKDVQAWQTEQLAAIKALKGNIEVANANDNDYNEVAKLVAASEDNRNKKTQELLTLLPSDDEVLGKLLTAAQNEIGDLNKMLLAVKTEAQNGTAESHDNATATKDANKTALTDVDAAINAVVAKYTGWQKTYSAELKASAEKTANLKKVTDKADATSAQLTKKAKAIETAIASETAKLKADAIAQKLGSYTWSTIQSDIDALGTVVDNYNNVATALTNYNAAIAKLEKTATDKNVTVTVKVDGKDKTQTYAELIAGLKTRVAMVQADFDTAKKTADDKFAAAIAGVKLDADIQTEAESWTTSYEANKYKFDNANLIKVATDKVDAAKADIKSAFDRIDTYKFDFDTYGKKAETLQEQLGKVNLQVNDLDVQVKALDPNGAPDKAIEGVGKINETLKTVSADLDKLTIAADEAKTAFVPVKELKATADSKVAELTASHKEVVALNKDASAKFTEACATAEKDINTITANIKTSYEAETLVTDWKDSKDKDGKVIKGFETLLKDLATTLAGLKADANAANDNLTAKGALEKAITTYGIADKMAAAEKALGTLEHKEFKKQLAGYQTESAAIDKAITDAYKNGKAKAEQTAITQRIQSLANNLTTFATNVPIVVANKTALDQSTSDLETAWTNAFNNITNNDASSKVKEWQVKLNEQKVLLDAAKKDVVSSYDAGTLLDSKKQEITKVLDGIQTKVTSIEKEQEAGYNAAIAADNEVVYNDFLSEANLTQTIINNAKVTIDGYLNINHAELKLNVDELDKVSKALKEIDVYQASLKDLKEKALKEYQDTKAPALFDVAGNNKKAANAYQGKVTDKMNSLSSIINKKANDLYAAKFTEGLAKSVTDRKTELDKVVYDKKMVTSAFTDVQKVIDEITALAADQVNLMINLDTQILDKIQNAEDAKLLDKATAKALNDDYSAKLSELEADAKAKETEMAAFVHADRDKDLDTFKKKVSASVGEAKKKATAEGLALTNYEAVKADFAKYADAKAVYNTAKNADGIAKANDVIRKELAPKFTELDTNLAAAEKYYLAYFFDTSALKTASKAIGIDINTKKTELEQARVDQLNKSDYEVAIADFAKRIEALYVSANNLEQTAISVAITGIETDKKQAVADFTAAGETEKAAEVENFFETNCKDLGTEFGKLKLPEGLAEIQATYIAWEQKVAKAHAGIINLWKADLTESTYKTLVQNFDVVKAEYDKLANIVTTGHEPVKNAYAEKAAELGVKVNELKASLEDDKANGFVMLYNTKRQSAIDVLGAEIKPVLKEANDKETAWKTNDTVKASLDTQLKALNAELETVVAAIAELPHVAGTLDGKVKNITDKIKTDTDGIALEAQAGKLVEGSYKTNVDKIDASIKNLNLEAHNSEAEGVIKDIKGICDGITLSADYNATLKGEALAVSGKITSLEKFNSNMVIGNLSYVKDINGNQIKDKDGKDITTLEKLPDYLTEVYPAVLAKADELDKELHLIMMKAKNHIGDADLDETVTVNDYSEVRSWIIEGKEYKDLAVDKAWAGDVNGDGVFTVADLTQISNIIFYGDPAGEKVEETEGGTTRARVVRSATSADGELAVTKTGEETTVFGKTVQIAVEVAHQATFTAGQFDIQLPAGMKLVGQTLSDRANGHELLSNEIADGKYRFLASTIDNNAFNGNSGAIVVLSVEVGSDYNGGDIQVSNVIFSDAKGRSYSITRGIGDGTGETTGINAITAPTMKERIFSIGGMVKKSIQKGINIIVGEDGTARKVVKK